VAHLEQLRELHNKLREEQQQLQQLRQALEREAAGKALDGARERRHVTSNVASWKTSTHLPSLTKPLKAS
jgi:hypothetical protein